jgi:hypothetical protein
LKHLAALEGSQGYRQIDVAIDHSGKVKIAKTFISSLTDKGSPSEEYLEAMKHGLRDCNLPKDYLESLIA